MPTPVTMPRLGESVSEGTIGAWLKKEGDLVERDEAIAEVITDKINAELPSPVAGRLTKLLVQVDATVPVGTPIALVEENVAVSATPPSASTDASSAAPGPDAAPVHNSQLVATPGMDVQSRVSASAGSVNGSPARATPATSEMLQSDEERQRISPLARRMAREHGVDLNDIVGTGINGRVRKEDILAYVEQRGQQAAAGFRTSSCTASSSNRIRAAY